MNPYPSDLMERGPEQGRMTHSAPPSATTDKIVDTLVSDHGGSLLDDEIHLVFLEDFVGDRVCDHLVGLAHDLLFARSATTLGADPSRTSNSAVIPTDNDPVTQELAQKVATITGRGVQCVEAFQVVRYESGEFFKPHRDPFPVDYMTRMGWSTTSQRRYTLFVYLNTVDNGGETDFPLLGLSFRPRKGCALFWENCSTPEKVHHKSLHQGLAPNGDLKFGLNVWVTFGGEGVSMRKV